MIKITVNEYAGDSSQDFNLECDSLTEALTIMAQYYERTLGAEKCEDSENMAQESVEVDWSEAPKWATMYGKGYDGDPVFYDTERYCYDEGGMNDRVGFMFGKGFYGSIDDISLIAKREL